MRHPFYTDHLSPEDQQAVRRIYGRSLLLYCSLLLITGAAFWVTADNDQTRRFSAASSAAASEQTDRFECAARDIKFVTSIEQHGEAQDVPAQDLADAFFTLMKARLACATGDVGMALAIYESMTLAPTQAAKR